MRFTIIALAAVLVLALGCEQPSAPTPAPSTPVSKPTPMPEPAAVEPAPAAEPAPAEPVPTEPAPDAAVPADPAAAPAAGGGDVLGDLNEFQVNTGGSSASKKR